jgi:hypothetical protein
MCPACISTTLMAVMAVGMTSTSGLAAVVMSKCTPRRGGAVQEHKFAETGNRRPPRGSVIAEIFRLGPVWATWKFARRSNNHRPDCVLRSEEK